jgi:uncharacterized protein
MLKPTGIITPALIEKLRQEFTLDWRGIHGIRHWGRVRANGLRLAGIAGANPRVVELFAVLHDSCRFNDGHDPSHGNRGAKNASRLQGRFFELTDEELKLLCDACSSHSDGFTDADVTVQVCWDADRLDLGRVGIEPHPNKLCTAPARDAKMIAWAYRRSLND